MNTSIQSGYNMINHASQTATKAAQEIQANSVQDSNDSLRAGAVESQSQSTKSQPMTSSNNVDPLIELNQAVQYNKVGTNIVQKNQEMIGSMLDVRV